MKFFSANIQSLRKLYIENLKKACSMEEQITKALPKMVEKSTDPELRQAFETHLRETEGHFRRVQGILADLTNSTDSTKSKPLAALVDDAESSIKDATDDSVRDVALIGAAQQVEHHEMAVYGTLRQWAHILGREGDAELLNVILQEEGDADHILTEIASRVNPYAERAA